LLLHRRRVSIEILLVLDRGGHELNHTLSGLEDQRIVHLRERHTHLLHGLVHNGSHLRHLKLRLLCLHLLGLLGYSRECGPPLSEDPSPPNAAHADASSQATEGKGARADGDTKDGATER